MTLLNLARAYWQGFVGGPDFNLNICHKIVLEDKLLTVNMPESNIIAEPSHPDVNYPHTSISWFKENAETYLNHEYVHMLIEMWMYLPPIALFPSSEYGALSCELRIKQNNEINVLDKSALGNYLTQAYIDFHNGPEGHNTRLRKNVEKRRKGRKQTPEELAGLEAEVADYIKYRGVHPLAPATIKKFNNIDWVFYSETRINSLSHKDYYCLPLSEYSFLEVKFNHRVDLPGKLKKWEKHALASQSRIMNSITLTDIPVSEDTLIAHKNTEMETS